MVDISGYISSVFTCFLSHFQPRSEYLLIYHNLHQPSQHKKYKLTQTRDRWPRFTSDSESNSALKVLLAISRFYKTIICQTKYYIPNFWLKQIFIQSQSTSEDKSLIFFFCLVFLTCVVPSVGRYIESYLANSLTSRVY